MINLFKTKQDKVLIKNISGAFVIKGLSLIISFASMPVYIKFFNNDEILGLWFTILSILTWVLTFDFGIGNGLRNNLIEPIEKKDNRLIKEYISSSYITLGFFTLFIALISIPIILFLKWNNVLNISNTLIDANTLKFVIAINITTVLLQFFLRIITSIAYALQKSIINDFVMLVTSTTQLLFAIFYIGGSATENLVTLSYVHLICVNLPLIITTIYIFAKKLRGMFPNFKMFNLDKAKIVLFDGSKIFFNQILYLILTGTNSYIITLLISNTQVVEYQQYYRIFMLIGTMYLLILTPLWSAVTKAHYNNDYKWIKKYFNLTVIGSLLVLFAQLLIIPFLQFGFNIWLGENAPTVNILYAVIFALFGFVFTFQSTVSTFAMGFNKTKLQAIMYAIAVVLKILLTVFILKSYNDWIILVIVDLFVLIPYCIFEYIDVKRIINKEVNQYEI